MAGNRSITVTLRANVQDFKSQFDAATKAAESTAKATEQSAKQAETSMGRMVQSAKNNQAAWTTAGTTLTAFGAATLGGLGLATKAAMDWESAFAGVRKTVDASESEFAALEAGLRGMARELPASHQEIAAVAEAAGQLGIATPNILSFTRTMIDMGEATNLSADEAATALARFITVTGTSQGDIGRLGATVVGLGNNFATTESEIVALSQRLAAAGTQAGLSEGEIMGLSAAMSQVGIEAEAGGSAMTQSMNRMSKAVEEGGDSLDLFAAVSGMTAEQFTEAWQNDPAQALVAFTEGLSDTSALGMSTNGVLTELGITGLREADTMRRLALATGVMSDAMALGNSEFEKGTALIEEANERYKTAESRVQIAKNAFVDAGISIGGVFLPAVADAAGGVADLAGWFADLPGPIHAALGGLAGIAGAASLGAGGFLLLFPRVMDTVQSFKTLADINPRVASGMGKVGRAAGIAGAAFAVLAGASAVAELFSDTAVSADEMSSKLANLAATAVVTAADIDEMVAVTGTGGASVKDFGYAIESVNMGGFMKALDSAGSVFGLFDSDVSLAKEQISSLDQALSTFAMAGTMDHLSETFNAAVESAAEYGYTAEDIIAQMPGLRTALEPIATEMGLTADNATLAKIATGELAPVMDETGAAAAGLEEGLDGAASAAEEAATATEDYRKSLNDLSNEFITAERAAMDYKESLKEAGKAVDENGKHWEDGTKAADANKTALLDLADQALATADSLAAEGKSGTFLEKAREDLIDVATEMTGSKEIAEEYVDQLLGTPEEIETLVKLETDQAKADWAAHWDDLGYNPPEVPISADTAPAEGEWDEFTTGILSEEPPEVPVDADTSGAQEEVTIWGSQVGDVYTSDVPINADIEPASWELNQLSLAVNSAGGTVTINGNATPGDQVLDSLVGIINNSDGTVTIDGTTYPADQALGVAIAAINRSGGTVDIDGNNSGAIGSTDSAVGHANSSSGSIDVNANTGSANNAINYAARTRTARINVSYSDPGFKGGGGSSRFASGGAVHGPGTGTSDSIDAKLSNNEHVWTANEVGVAGGHQAIYSLRQQILAGAKTLHLATGGGVENGSVAPVQYAPAYQQQRAQQSGPVTASVDQAGIEAAMVRGLQSATVIAQVTDRVAAGLYQRGKSNSRAMGAR
ncbi:phage tail tape measure protein [Brachybacterium tyrofermentans]|uniref:phage tail tape measure protein n=1 Tax=Brachybacterium tyrofermentans TaxID=47848 RepID=UPI0018682B23|nr:phage tail tape measure protein [Brachybacterium tyrofermentans]